VLAVGVKVVPTAGDGACRPTEVVAPADRSKPDGSGDGALYGTVYRPTGEDDCKVDERSE
jgi:hypothetical protein